MVSSRQLFSGFVAVVSQIFAIGLILWSIKTELGTEQLGVWALVLSSLSIVNVSGFGLGNAMIHYGSSGVANSKFEFAFHDYFNTALALTLVGSVAVSLLVFIPISYLLFDLIDPVFHALVRTLLPIMLVSLCAALLNRVMVATLNGLGWFWVGQIAILLGSVIYIVVALSLISKVGLLGVAYGHMAMTFVTLFAGWAGVVGCDFSRRQSLRTLWPFAWSMGALRQMIGFGVSLQVTSLLMVLLEPLARFGIGYAGGVHLVGYYEMANRLVMAPREIIARPAAYFAGRFATSEQDAPDTVPQMFNGLLKKFWWLGAGMIASLAIVALPAADFWVQERHWYFFVCLAGLGFGWAFAVPALIPWNWGVGRGINQFNLASICIMVIISATGTGIAIWQQMPVLVPICLGVAVMIGELYLIFRVQFLLTHGENGSNIKATRF